MKWHKKNRDRSRFNCLREKSIFQIVSVYRTSSTQYVFAPQLLRFSRYFIPSAKPALSRCSRYRKPASWHRPTSGAGTWCFPLEKMKNSAYYVRGFFFFWCDFSCTCSWFSMSSRATSLLSKSAKTMSIVILYNYC